MDAHDRAFAFFGGVPRKMVYDNLKTVVETVFSGKDRQFNRRFLALANHYLFEPVACTPASGWEKGQVENQVGNIREWLFTPTPRFADFAELNAWLERRCLELAGRTHPDKTSTIAEAWAAERSVLRQVSMPFEGYVEQPQRVSGTCLVTVDRNRYSVPAEQAGKLVSVRVSATHVRIAADGQCIAEHARLFGRDQMACQPWHYVPILETKPGALRHGQPFVEWSLPPAIEAVRDALLKQPKGDRAFADLLLAARASGLEALEVACQLALEHGRPNASVVLNELRRLTEPSRSAPVEVPSTLILRHEPAANCGRYDSLLGGAHA